MAMTMGEGEVYEIGVQEFVDLAESLLMFEGAPVVELRLKLVEALRDPSTGMQVDALYQKYERYLETMAENLPDIRGQIGVQILKAAVFRAAGKEDFCDGFLYDALVDANQAGLDDLVAKIRALRVD